MVAGNTTKKSERNLDFYPTDPRWVEVLLKYVNFEHMIDEPCCGDGAIVKVLRNNGHNCMAMDIHNYGFPCDKGDALLSGFHMNVITNPPYNKATEMINHWLDVTAGKVAVLMRIGYLGGKDRYEKFKGRRPHKIIIIVDRMKHDDGYGKMVSSQFEHIWLIWDNNRPATDESVMIWDRID